MRANHKSSRNGGGDKGEEVPEDRSIEIAAVPENPTTEVFSKTSSCAFVRSKE